MVMSVSVAPRKDVGFNLVTPASCLQLVNWPIPKGIRTLASLGDGVHPQCRVAAHPEVEAGRAVQSRSDRGRVTGVFVRMPEIWRDASGHAAKQRTNVQRVCLREKNAPLSPINQDEREATP